MTHFSDTDAAFAALARRLGTRGIDRGGGGWVEVGTTQGPVYVMATDDTQIEVSARAPRLDLGLSETALSGALRWNDLNAPWRLALDARGATLIGRRYDVRTMSVDALCDALAQTAARAARLSEADLPLKVASPALVSDDVVFL